MVRVWKTKSLLFCSRYDSLIVFRRQNHIAFIFIKTMSHNLLVQMAYKCNQFPRGPKYRPIWFSLPTVHSQLSLIFTCDDLFTTLPQRNVEYTWSVTTVPPKHVPFYSSLMQKLILVALNAPAFSHVIVS